EHARRDKTAEFSRADTASPRPPVGKKKRDPSSEKPKAKRKKDRLPAWWPWAAGWTVVVLAALAVWPFLAMSERQAEDDGQTDASRTVSKNDPKNSNKEHPAKRPTSLIMGPEKPLLPRLVPLAPPRELETLRQEFLGPFQKVPAPPPGAKLVRVRRLPGAGEYRSVVEALANTTGPLVVEI